MKYTYQKIKKLTKFENPKIRKFKIWKSENFQLKNGCQNGKIKSYKCKFLSVETQNRTAHVTYFGAGSPVGYVQCITRCYIAAVSFPPGPRDQWWSRQLAHETTILSRCRALFSILFLIPPTYSNPGPLAHLPSSFLT